MKLIPFSVLVLILINGCSTTHKPGSIKIPDRNEISITCIEDLLDKYPDISKYNQIFRFGYVDQLPEMREVHKQLGKPTNTGISFWNANHFVITGLFFGPIGALSLGSMFFIMQPVSYEEWNIGQYKIRAYIQQPISLGYERRLWYFEWKLLQNDTCG